MLRKLMKHEFRATARVMGPLYLVLIITALGTNLSVRGMADSGNLFLNLLGAMVAVAFTVAILGVCLMSFALMIQRFHHNLLRDEGYLMFTLPVSVHQQVWSKIIVSAVWFFLTGAAVMLSLMMISLDVGVIQGFFRGLRAFFQAITAYYALNGTAILLELLVLFFVGCAALCLQFYAAMAVGNSFANHKTALSVVFFFVFQFATQFISSLLLSGLDTPGMAQFLANLDFQLRGMAAIHAGIALMTLLTAIDGAVFYVITVYFLKNRLNLE